MTRRNLEIVTDDRQVHGARPDLKRMLVITSEPPWPPRSGGHLRTFNIHSALSEHMDIRIVCPVGRSKFPGAKAAESTGCSFDFVEVEDRTLLGEARRILTAQQDREPYVMFRRHDWPALHEHWRKAIDEFEPHVLWFDHIDSYLYHRELSRSECPAIIDMHNVYSLILSRLATESRNPLKRVALKIEANRMARMERRACNEMDAVVAVSRSECIHFEELGAKRVWLAPNGVSASTKPDFTSRQCVAERPIVLFLGAMNWQPNVSAALHLANKVFPEILRRYPHAQLKLVGRDPVPVVRALGELPGVTVTGTVPDVAPYLSEATVMAVPLESGGGTRLKILESFAAGLPVVSTPVGVEGIAAEDGVHLLVAELEQFPDAISRVFDAAGTERLVENAWHLVRSKYEWSAIADETAGFLHRLRKSG